MPDRLRAMPRGVCLALVMIGLALPLDAGKATSVTYMRTSRSLARTSSPRSLRTDSTSRATVCG